MPGRNGAPPLLGRFTLERLLARGASGSTWLAVDPKAIGHRHVALKLFNRQAGELLGRSSVLTDRLERLRGRTIAGLPTLRAFGSEHGQYYAAFSWHGGEPLDEVMAGLVAERSTVDRSRLVRQLARGLNTLHWGGFVHLSLSPSAIYYDRERHSLRLADWGHMFPTPMPASSGLTFPGVSVKIAPTMSAGGHTAGTAVEPFDVREDVFAFGCVAYELLTGAHPFDGRTAAEAAALGLVPAPAPELDGRQNLAMGKALAPETANRDGSLDAMTRAFALRTRPEPLLGALARLQRAGAFRKSATAIIPALAFAVVYGALAMWDTPPPMIAPTVAPVMAALPVPTLPAPAPEPDERVVLELEESSPIVPIVIAAPTPAVAIAMDGSAPRRVERAPVRESAPAPQAEPNPSITIAHTSLPAIGEARPPSTQVFAEPARAVVVESQPAHRIDAATIPLWRDAGDEVERTSTRARVVACAACDCPSLANKRSFTTEPLRREELEFLRHHCG